MLRFHIEYKGAIVGAFPESDQRSGHRLLLLHGEHNRLLQRGLMRLSASDLGDVFLQCSMSGWVEGHAEWFSFIIRSGVCHGRQQILKRGQTSRLEHPSCTPDQFGVA